MIQPFAHQLKAAAIAQGKERFAFFWSCGTGKTIAGLLIVTDKGGKWLAVCPKSIMRSAWERDAQHFPGIRTRVVHGGTPAQRKKAILAGDWDLAITNFETFKKHGADFLQAGVCGLLCDESSKIKSHESQTSKAVIAFADQIRYCYLFSGTPAPNNGTEYWPQLRALSPDAAGRIFWGWVNTRFIPIKRPMYRNGRRVEVISGWRQTPDQERRLLEDLRGWSWSLKKEDCLDLPEQMDREIEVELSDDEWTAYDAAETQITRQISTGAVLGFSQIKNVLMKLRQIVGGGVVDNGRGVVLGTSKLDALGEILDEIGPNEAVIVWAEFTSEIDRIAEYIGRRGESVAVIDGRTSGKAHEVAARFQAGELKRIVAHPAAAGHGITLTAASYAVYYSLSFSYEMYQQSRDRIHRAGQRRACTYYHLIATLPDTRGDGDTDTIDAAMLKTVRRKGTAAEAVRAMLKIPHIQGEANETDAESVLG